MQCYAQRDQCQAHCSGECQLEQSYQKTFCCSAEEDDVDIFGCVIAGCAGFVVVAVLIGICACCWRCRRRRRQAASEARPGQQVVYV